MGPIHCKLINTCDFLSIYMMWGNVAIYHHHSSTPLKRNRNQQESSMQSIIDSQGLECRQEQPSLILSSYICFIECVQISWDEYLCMWLWLWMCICIGKLSWPELVGKECQRGDDGDRPELVGKECQRGDDGDRDWE